MSGKFQQPFNSFNFRIPCNRELAVRTLEDLVINDYGRFKQNNHIESCISSSCIHSHGLKTLVLKSLTKVENLDIYKYSTVCLLKKYMENKYKIPCHLQILMHKQKKSREETKTVRCLLESLHC
uniref:Uncharacterized protein n=1 Tax=Clytia hemisphaerica TaxID=252671 RepID=A0A7M5WVG0_9CNID